MFWFLKNRKDDGSLEESPLSFGSKRIIAGMAIGLIMLGVYLSFALGPNAPDTTDVAGWARAILLYIGIGVVAMIVAMILFHILYSILVAIWQRSADEKVVNRLISSTIAEDERDKMISLKAMRVGYRVIGVGILLSLILFARGYPTVTVMHVLLGVTFLGCFTEGVASVIYHEKGV
jgi:hypothetical protein